MKSIVILIAFVIGACCASKEQTFKHEEFGLDYKIVNIDTIAHIYLIYAERDNVIYKIISPEVGEVNCELIREGGNYRFDLRSYFLPEQIHQKERLTGIKFQGQIIILEEQDGIKRDLFFSDVLKGLCYSI